MQLLDFVNIAADSQRHRLPALSGCIRPFPPSFFQDFFYWQYFFYPSNEPGRLN